MREVRFRHDRRQIIIPAAIIAPDSGNSLRLQRVQALIDTGATMSGVRREIAEALDLPRQGKVIITTPSGEHSARLYRLNIGVYLDPEDQLSARAQPYVLPSSFLAIQCSPGEAFDMLLGMDVLGTCDLQIYSSGFGTLTLPQA